jgi:DNA-binding PadR family transcriptional regulator
MSRGFHGEFEQLVLLAVIRLGDDAYGTMIRREIESQANRSVTVGALYSALNRLEEKGFLAGRLGDPTPERGGRAKRYYTVRAAGRAALRRSRLALDSMWRGVQIR